MRSSVLMLALIATASLSACKKEPPPAAPTPQPTPTVTVNQDSINRERMRQDSIRRAEEAARLAREAAARARTTLEQTVYFDYDEFAIRDDAKSALDAKLPILRLNPDVRMRIEGNADERGSLEYNLALGMRRATAARDYLTGFGLDQSRFEIASNGEERPADPGHDESAWARNRRDEFRIISGGDNLRAQ